MGVFIGRVYTKIGDAGTTRLVGGHEVPKTHPRIEAYGTLDELSAVLGLLAERMVERGTSPEIVQKLRVIQNELFDLGSELATLPQDRHERMALVGDADVERLERELDDANATLEPLRSFVLPGGGVSSAHFHLARTVCRRAERCLVALHEAEPQRGEALRYVNRLSDWLFVYGRFVARAEGHAEILWRPGRRG